MGVAPFNHSVDGFLHVRIDGWSYYDATPEQWFWEKPVPNTYAINQTTAHTSWTPANPKPPHGGSPDGDGEIIAPGAASPLSTVQFENARDGLEDFEYLHLLRSLLDRANASASTPIQTLASELRPTLDLPTSVLNRNLSRPQPEGGGDAAEAQIEALRRYRLRVAEAIERVHSALEAERSPRALLTDDEVHRGDTSDVFNVSYMSVVRFPMEGCGPPIAVCTSPPLAATPGPLAASISQPGISLRFPTRRHQFSLDRPTPNGSAGCFSVATGNTSAAGPGKLSVSAGNASTQSVEVEYYQSVAVAFGLRPYVSESTGTLLLLTDRDVIAAAKGHGASPATVTMELPFATPPRTVSWSESNRGTPLLREPEQVLSFGLDGLPATVNQDVKISISLPSGETIVKWRRLMRAPPLPRGSTVLPVQVDHSIKSLLVDGRPHSGTGFYLDEVLGHPQGAYTNLSECKMDPLLSFLCCDSSLANKASATRHRQVLRAFSAEPRDDIPPPLAPEGGDAPHAGPGRIRRLPRHAGQSARFALSTRSRSLSAKHARVATRTCRISSTSAAT